MHDEAPRLVQPLSFLNTAVVGLSVVEVDSRDDGGEIGGPVKFEHLDGVLPKRSGLAGTYLVGDYIEGNPLNEKSQQA